MKRTIYDPITVDVPEKLREVAQEEFGQHLIECRNRVASQIIDWIEGGKRFPIPMYDRLLEKLRASDPEIRANISAIALLMADEMVSGVLMVFSRSDDFRAGNTAVNYSIVAQMRAVGSDDVIEEVDVTRGTPIIVIWDMYKRWLSRFAPSNLRARFLTRPPASGAPPVD